MPYLLRFSGGSSTSGYISHAPALSGASAFDVEIDFTPRVIGSGYTPVYSNNSSDGNSRHAMYMWGSSRCEIAFIIGGVRRVLNSPNNTFTAGTRYKVNAIYDGSTFRIVVNGVTVSSMAASGTVGGVNGLVWIGANSNEIRAQFDLYGYKITQNGTLIRFYDPSNTSGGTTLFDTIGGQNGTQVDTWSAGDGEWVFYSSGASFQGTIGKTSLTTTTKQLSNQLGIVISGGKSSLVVNPDQLGIVNGNVLGASKSSLSILPKQQSVSAGSRLFPNKQSLTLSTKPLVVSAGYNAGVQKLSYSLNGKQLSIVVGANVPFIATLNKSSYGLSPKTLAVQAGWNSSAPKLSLSVNGKPESVYAGFVTDIQEQNIVLHSKALSLVTGTSVSFVGELNKSSLNVVGKRLGVSAGTVIPFQGVIGKTSLSLSGKALSTIRGQVLDIQKQSLALVEKQLSIGETIYPIVPIERLFTLKDGDRTYIFKQTTTIYIMKGK